MYEEYRVGAITMTDRTNYIDRQTAYEALTAYYHHSTETQHNALREALNKVPSVDAVESVQKGKPMVDIKKYLAQTRTVLLTQEAFDELVKKASADAVEVVRCKDCYHYDEESEKCILNNSEFKPMDYCSYGSE